MARNPFISDANKTAVTVIAAKLGMNTEEFFANVIELLGDIGDAATAGLQVHSAGYPQQAQERFRQIVLRCMTTVAEKS